MAYDLCASFVTSQIDEYATPSAARISSQTSEASLMSRISIFAPSAARRTAAARPSPAAAPETTAIRSFKRLILSLHPLCGSVALWRASLAEVFGPLHEPREASSAPGAGERPPQSTPRRCR